MKIYFCDLCNESVPNADLENGRAVMRNGRVICKACEGAMTSHAQATQGEDAVRGESPAAATVSAASTGGSGRSPVAPMALALAAISLLVALAGTAFLFMNTDERLRALEDELADARREARSDGRAIESRMNDEVRRTVEELASARAGLSELRARIDESGRFQAGEVTRLREDLLEWEGRLRDFDEMRTALDRHERDLSEVRDSTALLRSDLRLVGDRVQEQRDLQEEQAKVSEEAALEEEARPEWWPLVAELESKNSGVRWQAVQSLGATKDAAVAEHLTPMLGDSDIFVRMATARILGDLNAVVGIPALIDALEDPEASVREASVVSLRGVTGQNFRFDPSAKDSERAKRVKAWRDWWEKAADELLGS